MLCKYAWNLIFGCSGKIRDGKKVHWACNVRIYCYFLAVSIRKWWVLLYNNMNSTCLLWRIQFFFLCFLVMVGIFRKSLQCWATIALPFIEFVPSWFLAVNECSLYNQNQKLGYQLTIDNTIAYHAEAFSASKECVLIFTVEYVIIAPWNCLLSNVMPYGRNKCTEQ